MHSVHYLCADPEFIYHEAMGEERTFLIVKPEGVAQGHIGNIIEKFEKNGLKLVAIKLSQLRKELVEQQYQELRERDFFDALISYMTSAPTVSMVIEGENAIAMARKLSGATDPRQADPGTIRGEYGIDVMRNAIHASDSKASAERELAIHFGYLNMN